MVVTREQMLVFTQIIESETRIGDLYRIYARRLAEHATFWLDLAAEENTHAVWVRTLYTHLKEGTISFNEERFSPEAYQLFLDYLTRLIQQAETERITMLQALSIAKDIEETILEKNFFSIFFTEAVESKRLLSALHSSTEEHLRRVRALYERLRPARN